MHVHKIRSSLPIRVRFMQPLMNTDVCWSSFQTGTL
uniref:Uncharacterized protein n=1 Tax=Anguilla anguilla TaxID=7936 RepID=A0A0E9X799_ANGAN